MVAKILEGHGPLAEADIAWAEAELGVILPNDYRAFLSQFNGGYPQPGGFKVVWQSKQACGEDWRTSAMSWFYAITAHRTGNLVRMNKVTFHGRLPPDTITIASDAGGNQILLALAGQYCGQVLFWVKDHEVEQGEPPSYDNVGSIADSFEEFLARKLY